MRCPHCNSEIDYGVSKCRYCTGDIRYSDPSADLSAAMGSKSTVPAWLGMLVGAVIFGAIFFCVILGYFGFVNTFSGYLKAAGAGAVFGLGSLLYRPPQKG